MMIRLFTLCSLSLFLLSCNQDQDLPEPDEDVPVHDRMTAVIHPTEGNEASGVVTFVREGDNVRVTATVAGLEPESMHGFHIHEYGDCSAEDATSAGGHYNPYGMPHSSPTDTERHMGDLGNLIADEEGIATVDFVDEVLEMDGIFSILGYGVVVHAEEDDLVSQPTGDAGARIGCGVIGVAQPADAN